MKKLILAAIILVAALNSHAQAQQAPCIEVRGVARIDREVEAYLIDLAISVEYGETEGRKSFEDLKKNFFARAKEAGLDENRFKEDKMGYQALQFFREGSLYTFETSSRDELLKAAKLANGNIITVAGARVRFKPVPADEKLFGIAFRDCRNKAAVIAKAIGKKLGDALTVTDFTPQEAAAEENFYFKPAEDQYIYLSVRFAVE